jgi:elongation factor P
MNCKVIFHADEERPLSVELPSTYSYEITYTEPGIKGNTATNAMKPATIDTGAEVRVPLFIENGEKIVVNILEGTYRERSKE